MSKLIPNVRFIDRLFTGFQIYNHIFVVSFTQFARTFIKDSAVCGTITATKKHTSLSKKAWLTLTDIAVPSLVANAEKEKRC